MTLHFKNDRLARTLMLLVAASTMLIVGTTPARAQSAQQSSSYSTDGGWRTTIYPVYG